MFDLIAGNTERPLHEQSVSARLIAVPLYVIGISVFVVLSWLGATKQLPDVPTVLAFAAAPVEAPAAPPPPPPPPAPMPPAATRADEPPKHDNEFTAPVAAPVETVTLPTEPAATSAAAASVSGGVDGGLAGGVGGGIVGGLIAAATPPPPPSPVPPPPPPPPTAPVRTGGQIHTPTLEKRVEPTYSKMASAARLTGVVILEAEVGIDGGVKAVRVLRSPHKVLDQMAEEALLQWRYSPLVLNGIPTSFLVTVTFTFSLPSSGPVTK